jgi:hypothetical protein
MWLQSSVVGMVVAMIGITGGCRVFLVKVIADTRQCCSGMQRNTLAATATMPL